MSLWPELYGPLESSMLWSGVLLIGAFIAGSWKRIERLRFSAASGNERLQALNQPRSDAEALQLPITLTLRMTRLFAFFVALPSLLL